MTHFTLPKKRNGFALVDAMVALAIFAVMSALLFQTVSSTAMAKRHLVDSRHAIMVAQSRLAELQNEDGRYALQTGGRSGRFNWRSNVERFADSAKDNSKGLETISVAVTDSATGRVIVTLKSLRLAR
jgi:type II secretion system protein I